MQKNEQKRRSLSTQQQYRGVLQVVGTCLDVSPTASTALCVPLSACRSSRVSTSDFHEETSRSYTGGKSTSITWTQGYAFEFFVTHFRYLLQWTPPPPLRNKVAGLRTQTLHVSRDGKRRGQQAGGNSHAWVRFHLFRPWRALRAYWNQDQALSDHFLHCSFGLALGGLPQKVFFHEFPP